MTAGKIDRAKRLAGAKKKEVRRKESEAAFSQRPGASTILGEALLFKYDPDRRSEAADAALTLFSNDKMLIRAFQEFQLDPANPYHWKMLAQYMADTLFAKQGASQKWTRAAELRLVSAIEDAVQVDPAGPKKAVDRAVAALQKTAAYRAMTVSALRTKYYDARKKVRK